MVGPCLQVLQLRMGGTAGGCQPACLHQEGHQDCGSSSTCASTLQHGGPGAPASIALSHGQQQLLCLARMLLERQLKPRAVVLLDEITSSVDRSTALTMHQARPLHHSPCTVHNALCTMHHAPCTVHHAPCTMHRALCTMHQARPLHHSPCTVHHARTPPCAPETRAHTL